MMAWAMRGFTLGVAILTALTTWVLSRWLTWPAALCAAVVLAIAIHAAVVASGFALARLQAGRGDTACPSGWLAAMPREIWFSLRNMYLDIPWRHRWPMRMPARARGAVLLVHGYGCNRGIWRDFDTWLAARGWIVAALDLEPPRAGIDGFGAQVAAEAAAVALRTGHPRVTVIAHSMGGLATRAALRVAPDAPIDHVITLGTPHRGTWHARFGRGECAAQMLPESPWLCDLQTAETPAVASRCICIASHHDNIVCPVDRALLPGAAASLVVARVGHMALAHDAGVRAFIAERLAALHAPESAQSDAA